MHSNRALASPCPATCLPVQPYVPRHHPPPHRPHLAPQSARRPDHSCASLPLPQSSQPSVSIIHTACRLLRASSYGSCWYSRLHPVPSPPNGRFRDRITTPHVYAKRARYRLGMTATHTCRSKWLVGWVGDLRLETWSHPTRTRPTRTEAATTGNAPMTVWEGITTTNEYPAAFRTFD